MFIIIVIFVKMDTI